MRLVGRGTRESGGRRVLEYLGGGSAREGGTRGVRAVRRVGGVVRSCGEFTGSEVRPALDSGGVLSPPGTEEEEESRES